VTFTPLPQPKLVLVLCSASCFSPQRGTAIRAAARLLLLTADCAALDRYIQAARSTAANPHQRRAAAS